MHISCTDLTHFMPTEMCDDAHFLHWSSVKPPHFTVHIFYVINL